MLTARRPCCPVIPLALLAAFAAGSTNAAGAAIREVDHHPSSVIQVAVARGVVTLLQLPDGDPLRFVAVGRAADCAKADDAWCVSAPADTTLIFAKAKSRAGASNNLEVVTNAGRKYSFRLVVGDERAATQRLVVRATSPVRTSTSGTAGPLAALGRIATPDTATHAMASTPTVAGPETPSPALRVTPAPRRDDPDVIAQRLSAAPRVANGDYSLSIGERSDDIVPTAVFDDGLFTYLRLPGNRDVPAVFHVMADGQETMVNTRMESDLVVVDRVSRQLRLRVGMQVVSVFNDAFDIEGRTVTATGMTVDGVERVVRASSAAVPKSVRRAPSAP